MGVETFLDFTRDLDIDLLLPNKEEGATLAGENEPGAIAESLAELFPGALIALKLDAHGALILNGEEATPIPAGYQSPDRCDRRRRFFRGASFLARYLRGESPETAARFATRISAWVIEHLGARPNQDGAAPGTA